MGKNDAEILFVQMKCGTWILNLPEAQTLSCLTFRGVMPAHQCVQHACRLLQVEQRNFDFQWSLYMPMQHAAAVWAAQTDIQANA